MQRMDSAVRDLKDANEHCHSERHFLRRGRTQSGSHDAVPRSRKVAADHVPRVWPRRRQIRRARCMLVGFSRGIASPSSAKIGRSGRWPTWPALLLGAVTVPLYTTLTAEQTAFVLNDSGCRTIFLSSDQQLHKILSILPQTQIEKIVVMDPLEFNGDLAPFAGKCVTMKQIIVAGAGGPRRRDRRQGALHRVPTIWPRSSTPRERPALPKARC